MTQLRKAMLEELQRRNLSPITTRIYLRAVEEFAALLQGSLAYDQLESGAYPAVPGPSFHRSQAGAPLLSANNFLQLCDSSFSSTTLKRPWMADDLPVPKRPFRLPEEVLSREEVERLIQGGSSLLHRIWLLILSMRPEAAARRNWFV